MNSADFIKNVGAEYLNDAYGTSSGTEPDASTEYFNDNYKAFSGLDPAKPGRRPLAYDAGAIVGLAIAMAGKARAGRDQGCDPQGASIRTARVIHAGKDEFAKALALIKDGKPIRYEGVIGPVAFDEYGDITGPFRLWQITERRDHDGRRDVDRRRRRDQGEDRQVAIDSLARFG